MESMRELEAAICDVVRGALPRKGRPVEISPSLDLRRQLDIDSIGLLSIIFTIEEKLGVDMFQYADRLADATLLSDLIAVARDAKAANAMPKGDIQ